ncbi:MAG: HD domain-containing protein [Actinobacteria bacterium]|nr:HD domain-containing protein [Actinomycetota bacterium]MBM3712320.1 HD domain-containing protein [Actinomycetota bacterium]
MNYINKDFLVLSKKQNVHLNNLKELVRRQMPVELYKHSIGTLNYSIKLASIYFLKLLPDKPGNELLRLYYKLCLSCILHDYGKIFKYEELLRIAVEEKIKLSDFELKCKSIIHGFVTPFLIKRDFGINDDEIGQAIKCHTIGSYNMTLIDRLLYISDKVEETRNYEEIDYLRKLSETDLSWCLLEVYKSNIIYVINKNNLLHPDTAKIWNYICGGFKNAI